MNYSKVLFISISAFLFFLFSCQKEPNADFKTSKIFTVTNDTIKFTNLSSDADHYQWEFNDGTRSTEKSPVHIYSKEGDYLVVLYAFSKNGKKSNSFSQKISIGPSPTCQFSYTPKFPKPGETVHFLDNSLNSPTAWQWDFGDGTTSTEKNPNHIFTTEKKYNLSLTVTNNFSSSKKTDTLYVLINTPVLPIAKYIFTLEPNLTVNFLDQSEGNPTMWLWNLGDETTSTLQNPIHQYSHGAYYYVTLRVFNLAGSQQITQMINLPNILPIAKFIYSEGRDDTIYFYDKSSGNPILWEWNFGDGTTSNLQNPIHHYSLPETYMVTLKVTNIAGTSQITELIDVSNHQYSFFIGNYNVTDENFGNIIHYSDQITGSIEATNKFFTGRFGNYDNASVYFLASGTTVTVPSQVVHCGTPPNDLDHTFKGNGYFNHIGDSVKMVIDYTDYSTIGNFIRTGSYTKILN